MKTTLSIAIALLALGATGALVPTSVKAQGKGPTLVTDTDEPGRIPFQATVSRVGQCGGSNACFFNFGIVPQGKRIVVQHISGISGFVGTPTQVLVTAQNGSGSPMMSFLAPIANTTTAYDKDVLFYVHAGQLMEVQVSVFPATFGGSNISQFVTLTGYTLDCATIKCTAIDSNGK